MDIDVRIRWSHLDTDEEHVVIERVPLPRTAVQRERQLRELTFLHHPNATQNLYNHDEGKAAYVARPWLVVTMYLWGSESDSAAGEAAPIDAMNETMPLFGA